MLGFSSGHCTLWKHSLVHITHSSSSQHSSAHRHQQESLEMWITVEYDVKILPSPHFGGTDVPIITKPYDVIEYEAHTDLIKGSPKPSASENQTLLSVPSDFWVSMVLAPP